MSDPTLVCPRCGTADYRPLAQCARYCTNCTLFENNATQAMVAYVRPDRPSSDLVLLRRFAVFVAEQAMRDIQARQAMLDIEHDGSVAEPFEQICVTIGNITVSDPDALDTMIIEHADHEQRRQLQQDDEAAAT